MTTTLTKEQQLQLNVREGAQLAIINNVTILERIQGCNRPYTDVLTCFDLVGVSSLLDTITPDLSMSGVRKIRGSSARLSILFEHYDIEPYTGLRNGRMWHNSALGDLQQAIVGFLPPFDIVECGATYNIGTFQRYSPYLKRMRGALLLTDEALVAELGFEGLAGGLPRSTDDYLMYDDHHTYLIAIRNDEAVGALCLSDDHDGATFGIEWLYVDEAWRGKGVGTTLTKWAIRTVKNEGGKKLSLSVVCNNPAMDLYEKIGFQPTYSFLTLNLDEI